MKTLLVSTCAALMACACAAEEAPKAAAEKPAETPPAAEPAPVASANTYTAKEGDDIVSVAISYGISPSRLMDLNDLKVGDAIKPGQVLKLPADAKPSAQD